MLILGLSAFGQNPGACVLRDGRLVAFAEEERFLRVKGATGLFPGRAVTYCLKEAGARLEDVERIAIGWNAEKYRWRMPLFFLRTWWRHGRRSASGGARGTIVKEILDQQPASIRHRLTLALRRAGHGGRIPEIVYVDHHLAHAASAFYASGFDEAAIVIVDGSGEDHSTSRYHGNGLDIASRGHVEIPDSLGWFYAAVTAYLGFIPYEEEGFTMGLAPYGVPRPEIEEKMARLLALDGDGYRVDPLYTLLGDHNSGEHFSDQMVGLLGPPRLPGEPLTQRHKDLAFAAQARLEQAMLGIVRQATDSGRLRKLCLAGGVALNCKMNGVLAHSGLVDDLFVQPAAQDSGTALGAALWVSRESGEDPRFVMDHAQWGPSFSPAEVKKALDVAEVTYREHPAIEEAAADALAAGRIVAWFDGRMEAGPRALGGRSILADATRPGMNDVVNARVKFRDPWRPFCPSLTGEAARDLLDRPREARFMTVAYPVKEDRRGVVPAVIHVDGTTRPQTVSAAANPRYHRLLRRIGAQTGLEVVLNTSLNVKGEPIACTPMDALRCFYSSGIDALAIEGFWIEKG
jgi:carbamoyltransferase